MERLPPSVGATFIRLPRPAQRRLAAALNCVRSITQKFIDTLRTLMGGVPLQMPADSSLLDENLLQRPSRSSEADQLFAAIAGIGPSVALNVGSQHRLRTVPFSTATSHHPSEPVLSLMAERRLRSARPR
jgi:hypothetical protein